MFTTSAEPHHAVGSWAAIFGVLAIVGLLWAIGAVAQGQVQRAHARLTQPVQAAVAPGDEMKPVPVAYR